METKPKYGELAKRFQETMHAVIQGKNTDRKNQRLNHILGFFSCVNQLIINDMEKVPLLEQICTKMIESLGYYSAWIILPIGNHKEAFKIVSYPVDKVVNTLGRLDRGDLPACIRRAMEQDDLVIVRDPSSECPDCPFLFNYIDSAGMARRLTVQGRMKGILYISVPGNWADDIDERSFFNTVADYMAFSIRKLEVEEQVHRFKGVIDTIPHPVALISSDYCYQTFNARFTELYGMDRTHILGRTPADFFGQTYFETELKPYLDRCLAGEEISRQAYMELSSKAQLWMEMRFYPYRDENGRISGVVLYGIDTDEKRRH